MFPVNERGSTKTLKIRKLIILFLVIYLVDESAFSHYYLLDHHKLKFQQFIRQKKKIRVTMKPKSLIKCGTHDSHLHRKRSIHSYFVPNQSDSILLWFLFLFHWYSWAHVVYLWHANNVIVYAQKIDNEWNYWTTTTTTNNKINNKDKCLLETMEICKNDRARREEDLLRERDKKEKEAKV